MINREGFHILLVEDDRAVRITVRDALEEAGYRVDARADGDAGATAISCDSYDLLLSDVRLPGRDGIALFHLLKRSQPDCAAILMTAYGQVADAVSVMRDGADDYLVKPFDIDVLLMRVDRLAEKVAFRRALERNGSGVPDGRQLVGQSPVILQVLRRLEAAAEAGVNVLITGETGVGKEICAQTLHRFSDRANRPFVHLNCASIPAELFEAEMFGHERGAFTGAVKRRVGRMEAANHGTLFLDEIGELSAEHQAKLLRALDSGAFEPVGTSRPINVDVRLVSATNRDLRERIDSGGFRQDLYFRLNVIEIAVPPLRERRVDVPELLGVFLARTARRREIEVPALSPAVIAALIAHDYPGNVRELLHAVEHGIALSRGRTVELEHLPGAFRRHEAVEQPSDGPLPLAQAIRQFEQVYIERMLQEVGGKRAEAARLLGISRKSLWQKLKD